MSRSFQGRLVQGGAIEGHALISEIGFNALAAFSDAILDGTGEAICGDKQNIALFGKNLAGSILCAPKCVGSTTAGPVWEYVAEHKIAPKAVLLAGTVDTLTAGGLILTDIWIGQPVTLIDRLGDSFLAAVQDGCPIKIDSQGKVFLAAP